MSRFLFLVLFSAILAACAGDSSEGTPRAAQPGEISIACIVVSGSSSAQCPSGSASASAAQPFLTVVDGGTITRADTAWIMVYATNATLVPLTVYTYVYYDAWCPIAADGSPTANQDIVTPGIPKTVPAESTVLVTGVGGTCDQAPLGARTLTGIVYGGSVSPTLVDLTELDRTEYHYTLVP